MKILIIGNGFDIAHTLNTRYSDFQLFVDRFETEYERKDIIPEDALLRAAIGNPKSKEIARLELFCMYNMLHNIPEVGNFFHSCVSDNLLLEYFRNQSVDPEYKWMDYESEIENLIKQIDKSIGTESVERQVEKGLPYTIANYIHKKKTAPEVQNLSMGKYVYSYKSLLSRLNYDLMRITNALEIYMVYFVQECNWMDDSSHRGRINYKPFSCFSDVDKLLSFNYTDTFQRQYNKNIDSCYVHGKACIIKELFSYNRSDSSIERVPSIVLGISDENGDGELQFCAKESLYYDFQKFMLRERCGDKHWIEWIKNNDEKYDIYIVGHSLPYSDKDILEAFLLLPESNSGSIVNIYYYNEEARNDLQRNLLKIIGKTRFKRLSETGIFLKPVGSIRRNML